MPVTIAQVRKMALALPETAEVIAWESELTWRVNLGRVAASELRELITESWRQIAPKRLVKTFDAGT